MKLTKQTMYTMDTTFWLLCGVCAITGNGVLAAAFMLLAIVNTP